MVALLLWKVLRCCSTAVQYRNLLNVLLCWTACVRLRLCVCVFVCCSVSFKRPPWSCVDPLCAGHYLLGVWACAGFGIMTYRRLPFPGRHSDAIVLFSPPGHVNCVASKLIQRWVTTPNLSTCFQTWSQIQLLLPYRHVGIFPEAHSCPLWRNTYGHVYITWRCWQY